MYLETLLISNEHNRCKGEIILLLLAKFDITTPKLKVLTIYTVGSYIYIGIFNSVSGCVI